MTHDQDLNDRTAITLAYHRWDRAKQRLEHAKRHKAGDVQRAQAKVNAACLAALRAELAAGVVSE